MPFELQVLAQAPVCWDLDFAAAFFYKSGQGEKATHTFPGCDETGYKLHMPGPFRAGNQIWLLILGFLLCKSAQGTLESTASLQVGVTVPLPRPCRPQCMGSDGHGSCRCSCSFQPGFRPKQAGWTSREQNANAVLATKTQPPIFVSPANS